MALSNAQSAGVGNSPTIQTRPDNYTALDDFLLASANGINKPDVRDMLVKTYGDQGITGFLTLTGAVKNAGTADQVEYFEEERRHSSWTASATIAAVGTGATTVNIGSTAQALLQPYDVFMDVTSGDRFIVHSLAANATGVVISHLGETGGATGTISAGRVAIIGNMYPQGYNQPTKFSDPNVVRRQNPFMIVKEKFEVSGSQATNVGYINTGNGDYRWFMYGEQEARKRFLDKREMMMLFASNIDNLGSDGGSTGLAGSEGYFTAIERRGNIFSGTPTGLADVDLLIAEMDKQGAPSEYAMYLNRTMSLAFDDMLATGLAGSLSNGLPSQFGAFNNSPDMAVQLGFKSFTRGGYTFHKHDWKLLNDHSLLAGGAFKGALLPMSKVADARTGVKAPALELNYKSTNGYDRELNHWVTGGAVLGYTNNGTDGKDVATFHYRSECNLVTRAANQHFAFKG